MNIGTFKLVGKIKGLAGEISHLKVKPIKRKIVKGYDSSEYWNQKVRHQLKVDTRHHLLALAFLRNVTYKNSPYARVEQKCDVQPSVAKIVRIAMDHNPICSINRHSNGFTYYSANFFTEEQLTEKVTAWLKGGV